MTAVEILVCTDSKNDTRRGTLSFLDSSNGSGGQFSVGVRSVGLMEEGREGLKSITGAIEQGGGCRNVSFLSSVQVAIPEETFNDDVHGSSMPDEERNSGENN